MELFGRAGSDGNPAVLNFWEATGGRASITNDGLAKFLPTGNPALGVGSNGGALGLNVGSSGTYDSVVSQNISAFFGVSGESVRIAVGDVDGDNIPDYVVATGPGVPTRFGVFSGDQTRWIVAPTAPFRGSEDFDGGAFVSVGDIDGDGRADVVDSADNGSMTRQRGRCSRTSARRALNWSSTFGPRVRVEYILSRPVLRWGPNLIPTERRLRTIWDALSSKLT